MYVKYRAVNVIFVILGICVVNLTACDPRNIQLKFTDTIYMYNGFIRWNDFESAWALRLPPRLQIEQSEPEQEPDFKRLKNVKITRNNEKGCARGSNEHEFRCVSEIQYYYKDIGAVKTIEDNQLWVYIEADKRWYIKSGLPILK